MNYTFKKFDELKNIELYNILRLRNEVFIVEQECPYVDCDNKDIGAYHLLIEEHGKLLAYLRILDKGVSYDEVSIGRVIVTNECRGKGIAKEMMTKSLEFIKENLNENEVRISAQSYALKLYESVGFKIASEEYLEDDIPHIDMIYKG